MFAPFPEQEAAEETYKGLLARGFSKEDAEEFVRDIFKKANFSFLL